MWRYPLVLALIASAGSTLTAQRQWQHGIWRDLQIVAQNSGTVSLPIGGTPSTTVGNVTFPGAAPMYFTFPVEGEMQFVTIDGPNRLRYVARWRQRFTNIVINDPIDFDVDGDHLYVRGLKKGQVHKLEIVSTTRLPE